MMPQSGHKVLWRKELCHWYISYINLMIEKY